MYDKMYSKMFKYYKYKSAVFYVDI